MEKICYFVNKGQNMGFETVFWFLIVPSLIIMLLVLFNRAILSLRLKRWANLLGLSYNSYGKIKKINKDQDLIEGNYKGKNIKIININNYYPDGTGHSHTAIYIDNFLIYPNESYPAGKILLTPKKIEKIIYEYIKNNTINYAKYRSLAVMMLFPFFGILFIFIIILAILNGYCK